MNDVQMTPERPVFIPFEDGELFAVISHPTGPSREIGVVIAHGRGNQVTFHRNQVTRRLASRLAAEGFHVVRFDYPGIGDSTGSSRGFALTVTQDLEIARVVEELREAGLKKYILVGYCVGGRSALAVSQSLQGVVGVVLGSTPLKATRIPTGVPMPGGRRPGNGPKASGFPRRSPLKRLGARVMARGRRARAQASGIAVDPRVRRQISHLVKSGPATLLVYGQGDEYLPEARELMTLAHSWTPTPERLQLHDSTPGVMHGFLSIRSQEAFIDVVVGWATNLPL